MLNFASFVYFDFMSDLSIAIVISISHGSLLLEDLGSVCRHAQCLQVQNLKGHIMATKAFADGFATC